MVFIAMLFRLLVVLGVVGGVVYAVHRLQGGGRARDMEAGKRDFERQVQAENRRKGLPKG